MAEQAIQVENLGKRFRLGVGAGGYDTLRDALARAVRSTTNDERELWALRGARFVAAHEQWHQHRTLPAPADLGIPVN